MQRQRGFTLVEALAAVAVTATGIGALVLGIGAFARFGAHAAGPNRLGALALAERVVRSAEDAWKYGSPGSVPAGSWVTAIPVAVPSAVPTSVPATATATLTQVSENSALLTVTIVYTPDANHADPGTVTRTATLDVKAPLPGSQLVRPGLVPLPAGAP